MLEGLAVSASGERVSIHSLLIVIYCIVYHDTNLKPMTDSKTKLVIIW